jgi:diguanylate cyclase (GGDEF)-like protein
LVLLVDRQSGHQPQVARIGSQDSLARGDRLKHRFALLVLFVGVILAQPVLASDLIVSRTMLDDPTGALTIADVAGRVTTPVQPSIGVASTNTAHWLCLRVRQPANGSKVVLFIRPSFLNEIRLYEAGPGNPLAWKTRVTGNHYPYSERDRPNISLGFVVNVTGPEATYYLRLKTRSPSWLDVTAVEPATAEALDQQRDLVIMFFATAMLCLLLWAILSYFENRQPVVGLFAIHQAVYTGFGLVSTGYLAPLVPVRFPQLADSVNIVLYCAISFTPLLFCRELFRPYEPPPRLMRGLNLLMWIFPVLLVSIALGYDTQAVTAANVLIKITWLYFVVVAFSLRVERTPSRRLLQIFFVLILMNNVVYWLASRSSRIASVIGLTAIQTLIIDGLVIGGLFAMILHTRARQTLREAQQSAVDLLLVQKKFEIEQKLKEQAELQAKTDYLTGLFNRRYFVESAERELMRAVRFQRPLTLLMIDIDHFKAINDTWGHGVGDIVLQNVSHLLHETLRSVDIFGRTGGEEFAAVLVETDGPDAFDVAKRLCKVVADAVIVPPGAGRIQVTVSIGLSQLKERKILFDGLMNEADQAMYTAKQTGRNRFVASE